jgi:hypothetical protein
MGLTTVEVRKEIVRNHQEVAIMLSLVFGNESKKEINSYNNEKAFQCFFV